MRDSRGSPFAITPAHPVSDSGESGETKRLREGQSEVQAPNSRRRMASNCRAASLGNNPRGSGISHPMNQVVSHPSQPLVLHACIAIQLGDRSENPRGRNNWPSLAWFRRRLFARETFELYPGFQELAPSPRGPRALGAQRPQPRHQATDGPSGSLQKSDSVPHLQRALDQRFCSAIGRRSRSGCSASR